MHFGPLNFVHLTIFYVKVNMLLISISRESHVQTVHMMNKCCYDSTAETVTTMATTEPTAVTTTESNMTLPAVNETTTGAVNHTLVCL